MAQMISCPILYFNMGHAVAALQRHLDENPNSGDIETVEVRFSVITRDSEGKQRTHGVKCLMTGTEMKHFMVEG